MVNYKRELRMEVDLKRKGKIEKVTEFVKIIKRIQKKAGVALKRVQEEIKRQADRERKKAEIWKVEDRVMLDIKNLVFKERPAKK